MSTHLVTRSTDIDPHRWPDIAKAPTAPARAWVAARLLSRIARTTPVRVLLPHGMDQGAGEPHWPTLQILDSRFFDRLGADLKIGLGEAYMAGDWAPGAGSDLADVLTPFAERLQDIVPGWMRTFRRSLEPRQPRRERNDRSGARANIARHYDLSNALFSTFLDSTLTYSAALFDATDDPSSFASLATAQRRKIERVLDLARVGEGTRLLEIGTGWGQLALQAAARGAIVHTITLSEEQRALAVHRVEEANLGDRVTIELRDYRDVSGTYDAVVSVEMIEAVGAEYWPAYFASIGRLLRPGGRMGLQAITMPHDRMLASRHAYSWIHKYVFPGGLIPSPDAIRWHAAHDGGMRIVDEYAFGNDYARTLRLWRERFVAQRETVQELGFDETFQRLWEFYLAYSEAGFRSAHLDVRHFAMERAS